MPAISGIVDIFKRYFIGFFLQLVTDKAMELFLWHGHFTCLSKVLKMKDSIYICQILNSARFNENPRKVIEIWTIKADELLDDIRVMLFSSYFH